MTYDVFKNTVYFLKLWYIIQLILQCIAANLMSENENGFLVIIYISWRMFANVCSRLLNINFNEVCLIFNNYIFLFAVLYGMSDERNQMGK